MSKTYRYLVQDKDGGSADGRVTAADEEEAIRGLQKQGYLILSISETGGAGLASGRLKDFLDELKGDVRPKDLLYFSRELAALLKGGIAMLTSLRMLARGARTATLRKAIEECASTVQRGKSLSFGLEQRPAVFPPLLRALVKVGEDAGQLPGTLQKFAGYVARQEELRNKIMMALQYPILVMVFAFAVVIFMGMKVVPTFAKLFVSLKVPLPMSTKIIIGFSNALVEHTWSLAAMLVACLFILKGYLATDQGRRDVVRVQLNAPLFGDMFRDAMFERYFSTLSLLINSGVSLMQAFQNMKGIFSDNFVVYGAIEGIEKKVAAGETMAGAMRKSGLFSEMAVDSVSIAEESGAMVNSLQTLSEYHGEHLDIQSRQLATMLEPIMIVLVGGVVLFVMYSLFIPMLDLTNIRMR